ncbi:expressed unknown protein [Seminavis robusta]|uniref:Uncharacterized protein n=1 Tax=Seminavis robusta TaxID=568900 RepID=A0A9N8E2C6_9STRA|nr:expressed unknown protein [Seminavis robusta]|eukprot:Sro583_g170630.1 n/a (1922) ;mRNA; f:13700-19465
MYKPSPEALKSMMVVKPQGDDYESREGGTSTSPGSTSPQKTHNSGFNSKPASSSDEDDSGPLRPGHHNPQTHSHAIKSKSTNSTTSPSSSSAGPAGLFAEKKDSKPMPMNPRRTIPLPSFTKREKKPRSATMLRRTGSHTSSFTTDAAMSVDHSGTDTGTNNSYEPLESSIEEETAPDTPAAPVSNVIVKPTQQQQPRAASPFSLLSDDVSSEMNTPRQDEILKQHQEKMEELEAKMQLQIQEQQRQHAEIQQKLLQHQQMQMIREVPSSQSMASPTPPYPQQPPVASVPQLQLQQPTLAVPPTQQQQQQPYLVQQPQPVVAQSQQQIINPQGQHPPPPMNQQGMAIPNSVQQQIPHFSSNSSQQSAASSNQFNHMTGQQQQPVSNFASSQQPTMQQQNPQQQPPNQAQFVPVQQQQQHQRAQLQQQRQQMQNLRNNFQQQQQPVPSNTTGQDASSRAATPKMKGGMHVSSKPGTPTIPSEGPTAFNPSTQQTRPPVSGATSPNPAAVQVPMMPQPQQQQWPGHQPTNVMQQQHPQNVQQHAPPQVQQQARGVPAPQNPQFGGAQHPSAAMARNQVQPQTGGQQQGPGTVQRMPPPQPGARQTPTPQAAPQQQPWNQNSSGVQHQGNNPAPRQQAFPQQQPNVPMQQANQQPPRQIQQGQPPVQQPIAMQPQVQKQQQLNQQQPRQLQHGQPHVQQQHPRQAPVQQGQPPVQHRQIQQGQPPAQPPNQQQPRQVQQEQLQVQQQQLAVQHPNQQQPRQFQQGQLSTQNPYQQQPSQIQQGQQPAARLSNQQQPHPVQQGQPPVQQQIRQPLPGQQLQQGSQPHHPSRSNDQAYQQALASLLGPSPGPTNPTSPLPPRTPDHQARTPNQAQFDANQQRTRQPHPQTSLLTPILSHEMPPQPRQRTSSHDSRASHFSVASQPLPQVTPERQRMRQAGFPAQVMHQYSIPQTPPSTHSQSPQESESPQWLTDLTSQAYNQRHQQSPVPYQQVASVVPAQTVPRAMQGAPGPTSNQPVASTQPGKNDPVYTKALADLWSQAETNHEAVDASKEVSIQLPADSERSNKTGSSRRLSLDSETERTNRSRTSNASAASIFSAATLPLTNIQARASPQQRPQAQVFSGTTYQQAQNSGARQYEQNLQQQIQTAAAYHPQNTATHQYPQNPASQQPPQNAAYHHHPQQTAAAYQQHPNPAAAGHLQNPATLQHPQNATTDFQHPAYQQQAASYQQNASMAQYQQHPVAQGQQNGLPLQRQIVSESVRNEFDGEAILGSGGNVPWAANAEPRGNGAAAPNDGIYAVGADSATRPNPAPARRSKRNDGGHDPSKGSGDVEREEVARAKTTDEAKQTQKVHEKARANEPGATGQTRNTKSDVENNRASAPAASGDADRESKPSSLGVYLGCCILLLLIAGGATVAVLYFTTDVFGTKDDNPTQAPVLPPSGPVASAPTTSPSSEATPESTPDGAVATTSEPTFAPALDLIPENATGLHVISNMSQAPSFVEGDLWEIDLLMTDSPSTGLDDGDAAGNVTSNTATPTFATTNATTSSPTGSAEDVVSANQTFAWEFLNLEVIGDDPGARTGSFVVTNSNGRVIAIGSVGQPLVVVYRLLQGSSLQQLGSPFPIVDGAAPVSAALNGQGSILAVGYDDGSVLVYQYVELDGEWVARGAAVLPEGGRVNASSVSVSLSSGGVILVVGVLSDSGTLTVQSYLYSRGEQSWDPVGDTIYRLERRSASVTVSASGFVMAFTTIKEIHTEQWGSVETFELDVYGGANTTTRGSFTLLGISDLAVSLSVNGTTMAVANDKRSSVYGYSESLQSWQVQPGGDRLAGGSVVSLAFDSELVAIGGGASDIVHTYERIDNWWRMHPSSSGRRLSLYGTGRDGFGSALSLSGDSSTLVVGAPLDDEGGDDAGKVYFYGASELDDDN